MSCLSFSQVVVLEDFEGTPEFSGFEGLMSATAVADPTDGTNTVLELVSTDGGAPWQGAEVIMQDNYMDVSTGNITYLVKLKTV